MGHYECKHGNHMKYCQECNKKTKESKSASATRLEGPTIDADKADELIHTIDKIGRGYCGLEYGLPVENEAEMGRLRRTILDWLKAG